jgi:hypothetical protein
MIEIPLWQHILGTMLSTLIGFGVTLWFAQRRLRKVLGENFRDQVRLATAEAILRDITADDPKKMIDDRIARVASLAIQKKLGLPGIRLGQQERTDDRHVDR